jgi:hypothetical protein
LRREGNRSKSDEMIERNARDFIRSTRRWSDSDQRASGSGTGGNANFLLRILSGLVIAALAFAGFFSLKQRLASESRELPEESPSGSETTPSPGEGKDGPGNS